MLIIQDVILWKSKMSVYCICGNFGFFECFQRRTNICQGGRQTKNPAGISQTPDGLRRRIRLC